ncbi:MAG: SEL1-like repeat protein [Sulfobacillus sp.]
MFDECPALHEIECLLFGGPKQDVAKGVLRLHELCRQPQAPALALYYLGYFNLFDCFAGTTDRRLGADLMARARADPQAVEQGARQLGVSIYVNNFGAPNIWYIAESERGHPFALRTLGNYFLSDMTNFKLTWLYAEANRRRGVDLLRRSGALGFLPAIYDLAEHFRWRGFDEPGALRLHRTAAASGYRRSFIALSALYDKAQRPDESLYWRRRALKAGEHCLDFYIDRHPEVLSQLRVPIP